VTRRTGMSLVELAIVAVILAVMVVAWFTLSRQETVSTRELQDRAHAMALARNLLVLVRHGHNRAWLDDAGVPAADGSFEFPASMIPLSDSAYGPALREWASNRSAEAVVVWTPEGGPQGSLGRALCRVRWQGAANHPRSIDVPAVIER